MGDRADENLQSGRPQAATTDILIICLILKNVGEVACVGDRFIAACKVLCTAHDVASEKAIVSLTLLTAEDCHRGRLHIEAMPHIHGGNAEDMSYHHH